MACKAMKAQLPSGHHMPLIGFGTFQIRGHQIRDILDHALAAGYRQIDTAAVYGNEREIGIALKELLPKYRLKREDVFITSKLSPADHGEAALRALEKSLRNIDCGYLDLYLIHWPGVQGISNLRHPDIGRLRALSWASLAKGLEQGIVRDIGVSNYTIRHLDEILRSSNIKPAVNQVEWHPHHHDTDLKDFCDKHGVLLQAYSSLGGSNNPQLISDPHVVAIAQKLGKSPAQVLLRWALQQNIGIIPKASSKERIEANIDLNFTISREDMSKLGGLKTKEKYAWDPEKII